MADPDCPFCKIVAGEIPAKRVYEDDAVLAFEDLNPQAPTHVLRATAEALQLTDFRTVFNTGAGVGQSVWHVHAHVLAGRPMGWPPG